MPKPSAQRTEIENEFYLEFGKAMDAWSMLELVLSWWFQRLTKMKPDMSAAIFYSGRSFETRKALLFAAADKAGESEEVTKFFRSAVKKAHHFSESRNKSAHRIFVYEKNSKIYLQEGHGWHLDDGITS
ncbi:MAG: hypothetical protein JOY65_06930, partial [Acetobacteraceae bacterium]|nr:hypothetical protein [Acetobacteraceae bacterium]